MSRPDPLRAHLARVLDWEQAHVGFDKAVAGVAPGKRAVRAAGFEHSLWQLVEHMRLGQRDLLDFCVKADYAHVLEWPGDYWPATPAPPSARAWDASIQAFHADRGKLKRLVRRPTLDLLAPVPTGAARQTYLRAILLVADHNAYHIGQIVAVRRALGIWP